MQKRTVQTGFTLIELLVVVSIIALLIGILLPALGAARLAGQKMKSNTQLRGIQQNMVIYAQGNKGWYPGIRSNGATYTNPAQIGPGIVNNGSTVEGRFGLMLYNAYFKGEYVLSPSAAEADKVVWSTDNVSELNYSYAMLCIYQGANYDADNEPVDAARKEAREEWKNTTNEQAVVLSDRNLGDDSGEGDPDTYQSVWSKEGEWTGGVTFNDNHTKNTPKPIIENITAYGTYKCEQDDLFGSAVSGTVNDVTPVPTGADDANAFLISYRNASFNP